MVAGSFSVVQFVFAFHTSGMEVILLVAVAKRQGKRRSRSPGLEEESENPSVEARSDRRSLLASEPMGSLTEAIFGWSLTFLAWSGSLSSFAVGLCLVQCRTSDSRSYRWETLNYTPGRGRAR